MMKKITLRPGIDVQKTPLLNEGGWSSANLVRFRNGLAEVIGGWVPVFAAQMLGICRGLMAWSTLDGIKQITAGTNLRLYTWSGNTPTDITPFVQTTTPTNPFTSTSGSPVFTVSDPSVTVTLVVGSLVEISGASAVGGIVLTNDYSIVTVVNSTTYTITAVANASSSATGGGTPTIKYGLPAGNADQQSSGFLWINGTWARTWTLDHFGEIVIACPFGGGIYASTPLAHRATAITNAPIFCNAIVVSNGAQQIIALGGTAGGQQDPMLVQWCDSGNYTVWTAAVGNAAGSFPLTDGSAILWGGRAAQQILIWTDTSLWAMNYIGGVLIYGFVQLGSKCGLISPLGAAIVGSIAIWMSGLSFMWYNGTVQELDCPVRDIVYKNLNLAQASKIVCSTNTQFSEIRWDYPSLGATENDSYVIVHYGAQPMEWTFGTNSGGVIVARTAWTDYSVFGNPMATDASGNLWFHESGYSANGVALPWFIETSEFDITDGQDIMFCDQIIPDQVLTGGTIAIWVYAQRYPNDPVVYPTDEPYPVTSSTQAIPARSRGRQLSLRIDNSLGSVGVFWRMGALRLRIAPDGRG